MYKLMKEMIYNFISGLKIFHRVSRPHLYLRSKGTFNSDLMNDYIKHWFIISTNISTE